MIPNRPGRLKPLERLDALLDDIVDFLYGPQGQPGETRPGLWLKLATQLWFAAVVACGWAVNHSLDRAADPRPRGAGILPRGMIASAATCA